MLKEIVAYTINDQRKNKYLFQLLKMHEIIYRSYFIHFNNKK